MAENRFHGTPDKKETYKFFDGIFHTADEPKVMWGGCAGMYNINDRMASGLFYDWLEDRYSKAIKMDYTDFQLEVFKWFDSFKDEESAQRATIGKTPLITEQFNITKEEGQELFKEWDKFNILNAQTDVLVLWYYLKDNWSKILPYLEKEEWGRKV